MLNSNGLNNYKIAMMGLANAGKTSIIRTIQKTYHIGQSIAPTKSAERTIFKILGQNGIVWDFGGQVQYRDSYLKKPERYLADIRYLFYVIDIQDPNTFTESLNYFTEIFQYSHQRVSELIVSILFHKTDPSISETPEIRKRIHKLKKQFHEIIENREMMFFETSVFDAFSLLTSISLPILGNQVIYNKLSVLFANYSIEHSVDYMNIVVDDLLELGKFRLHKKNQEFLEASMEFYKEFASLEIDTKFRSYNFEGYRFVIIKGKSPTYYYTVNLAHSLISETDIPSEESLWDVLNQVNNLFEEYHPFLH